MNAILAIQHVSAGYGRTSVLDDVSIPVGASETVVLLGPNGSGKSTVARTAMGLTTLYSGTIRWQDQDISHAPCWRRSRMGIGYVPQVSNVFLSLQVHENLLVGTSGLSRATVNERLDSTYTLFPLLAARRTVAAGHLSGGERRLLAFATTLVQSPKLLVLDEPTSDLAPTAIDLVFEKIHEIRNQLQLPLLMIEQNVDLALELAHRVCILVRGRLVIDCPAADIDEQRIGQAFLEHSRA